MLWLPFIVGYLNMAVFLLVLDTCTHCGSLEEAWLFLLAQRWSEAQIEVKMLKSGREGEGCEYASSVFEQPASGCWPLTPRQARCISFTSHNKASPPPQPHICFFPQPPLLQTFSCSVSPLGAWVLEWLLSWHKELPNYSVQERAAAAGQPVSQLLSSLSCPAQLHVASFGWSTMVNTCQRSSTVSVLQVLTSSTSCATCGQKDLCSGCEMDWERSTLEYLPVWWLFCSLTGGRHGFQSLQRSVLAAALFALRAARSSAAGCGGGGGGWQQCHLCPPMAWSVTKVGCQNELQNGVGWRWGSRVPVGSQFYKVQHCWLFCVG